MTLLSLLPWAEVVAVTFAIRQSCLYERPCRQEHIEQISKTVFMTREEAEEAVSRMTQ